MHFFLLRESSSKGSQYKYYSINYITRRKKCLQSQLETVKSQCTCKIWSTYWFPLKQHSHLPSAQDCFPCTPKIEGVLYSIIYWSCNNKEKEQLYPHSKCSGKPCQDREWKQISDEGNNSQSEIYVCIKTHTNCNQNFVWKEKLAYLFTLLIFLLYFQNVESNLTSDK